MNRNYKFHNPVAEEFVYKPEDYVCSSAVDYCGEKSVLNDVIVVS